MRIWDSKGPGQAGAARGRSERAGEAFEKRTGTGRALVGTVRLGPVLRAKKGCWGAKQDMRNGRLTH